MQEAELEQKREEIKEVERYVSTWIKTTHINLINNYIIIQVTLILYWLIILNALDWFEDKLYMYALLWQEMFLTYTYVCMCKIGQINNERIQVVMLDKYCIKLY